MKVLLIGGAGYIGSHVAFSFLEQGHTVGIFDNFSTGLKENIFPETQVFEGDILDKKMLRKAFQQGWDGIIHLAALKAAGESMLFPEKYAANNITGSLNIITEAAAAGIKRIVLSSSAAVYGEPEYLPIDEQHPLAPTNYYGFTKLQIEQNLQWFDTLKGIHYASLRYFNAAGYDGKGAVTGLERNPANLIPLVMETALGRRKELHIFGDDYPTRDGTGIRDYIHVTDLARAHIIALEQVQKKGESFVVNLGSESGISVLEIVRAAEKITGKKIPAKIVARRPGDPAELVASSKKAQEFLGWQAQCSSVEDILQTSWQVYRSGM